MRRTGRGIKPEDISATGGILPEPGDKRRLERMTWREAADALLEACHAVDCVPDPGLSGLRTLERMRAAHERALANAKTEAMGAVERLESEEL